VALSFNIIISHKRNWPTHHCWFLSVQSTNAVVDHVDFPIVEVDNLILCSQQDLSAVCFITFRKPMNIEYSHSQLTMQIILTCLLGLWNQS